MAKESNLELKVGGLVLLAFVGLTLFILSVGDFAQFQEGKTIKVIFGFASGVKTSAPVRVAGVEVGLVKDVRLFLDPQDKKMKAEVDIWVRKGTEIPVDSKVMINQLGLFGEKYIEVIPGIDQEKFFADGDEVIGKDPILQEQIAQKILDVADDMQDGIQGVNALIRDDANQKSLKTALAQISSVTERLDRVVKQVETGQGTIGKLLYDANLYDDLQMMSADLKENPWKLLYKPRGE